MHQRPARWPAAWRGVESSIISPPPPRVGRGVIMHGISRIATRRRFLQAAAMLAGSAAVAACSAPPQTTAPQQPAQAPKPAPTAAAKPADQSPASQAATAKPGAAGVAAPQLAGLKPVPRNRTLMHLYGGVQGKYPDYELWNPYAVGANHQTGPNLYYEPVAYYSAFADKELLWLAASYEYSNDFKQLTIKTRSGINWSDGKPFTAEDIAYTLRSLRDLGPKVRWGVDAQQFVDDGQDWTTFKAFDIANDLPVTTGPWKLVAAAPDQKIHDRRDTWWAATAGLYTMPKIERIIVIPSVNEQVNAQALISNDFDYYGSLQPATWPTVFNANPKIITHSGQKPPYGYQDWWPDSLYVNCETAPFDKADVRWAISHYIDRDVVVDVGWSGASEPIELPMPTYPGLKPFADAIRPLLDKYPTTEFNPKKGDELLTKNGFKKDSNGKWQDSTGKQLKFDIITTQSFVAVAPVVGELLKRQGIDATFSLPTDFDNRFSKGDFEAAIYGHGGSVSGDPYFTLRLYQSITTAVPGAHLVNFTRWKNEQYDKIVDEMAVTSPTDKAKLIDIYKRAMEIWLPNIPDIILTKFHHRIGMNTTYWQGWPTEDNPYVNGASWHLTWNLINTKIEPVQ